jgi:hypothetical protein
LLQRNSGHCSRHAMPNGAVALPPTLSLQRLDPPHLSEMASQIRLTHNSGFRRRSCSQTEIGRQPRRRRVCVLRRSRARLRSILLRQYGASFSFHRGNSKRTRSRTRRRERSEKRYRAVQAEPSHRLENAALFDEGGFAASALVPCRGCGSGTSFCAAAQASCCRPYCFNSKVDRRFRRSPEPPAGTLRTASQDL